MTMNESTIGPYPMIGSSNASIKQSSVHEIPLGEIAVGVIIGRASEHFDFFVYAIASVLVFPAVFFPQQSPLDGMLYSFVIFAFAFLARPFGTVAFMAFQRRYGRAAKLTAALFLLGTSTAGIAFLPTFDDIGVASVICLSVLRVGQGIATGGGWDGLPSLLALNSPPSKRGWYAMQGQLGAPIGFIFAAGLFWYLLKDMSSKDFLEWGWRYPFYVAFAINVVALFARLRIVSMPSYDHLLNDLELAPARTRDVLKTQKHNLMIGALAALASYALFHLVTVFPLSWVALYSSRSVSEFLSIQMLGACAAFVSMLASGLIADRFGRRMTLGALAILIACFSELAPYLMGGGDTFKQNAFVLVGFVLLGLSFGQAAGAVTSNFPSRFRYTGAALTADLAWIFGAAFAPLIVLGLSAYLGLSYVSIYLLSGALGTIAALSVNRSR